MSGVNKVILLGRLGKDPEVRTLENGAVVVSFPLATSEVYRDKNSGERKENTEWHNIVLWRNPAEIAAKYLKKGDQCYIEGKLRTRSWQKEGVTRYTTEIIGDTITLLGSRKDSAQGPGGDSSGSFQERPAAEPRIASESSSDDLPF